MRSRAALLGWVLFGLIGSGCGPQGEPAAESEAAPAGAAGELRPVDEARVVAAAGETQSWLTHGGTYAEQRFSPLSRIDESNVAELGLAWSFDMETQRGVEATPLVADGVMYVTGPWSLLHALDAASGEHLWTYDPGVPREYARSICCGVVNRGAALWGDKVFLGTLDGRLVAVDRASGEAVWETLTIEPDFPYSITGAPRAVEGLIVIGNAGADYGARGYVSAYSAETGELAWRTYTVPGNPADGFESEALERAAETWNGEWWKYGGGGTVWDAMAYDPELGLLYVGTGNGSPYPRWLRSPGGGDNLYLASILALRPQTGELVWHYQTTPAETWDYTATQHLMLVDLEIDGRPRKLILQAPKNGFFFVIDRETGEFLSAEPFVEVNWASGYDDRGRPIEGDIDYSQEPKFTKPSPYGAHSWPPMSFHPGTGLVYLPVRDMGFLFQIEANWSFRKGGWNTGLDPSAIASSAEGLDTSIEAYLLAWDPVAQREAWRVPHVTAFNGGTLSTAGNLVFQGSADGRFAAYRATDGERLWEMPAGTGVTAGPVSYEIGGEQYVAVAAGWGASFALGGGEAARMAGVRGGGRVLAFKRGGSAPVPPSQPPPGPVPEPAFELAATPEELERGLKLYHVECSTCHGALVVGGGSGVPDLRYSGAEIHADFSDVVLGGVRAHVGMPSFADLLSLDDARLVQAYILQRAAESAGGF